MEITEFSVNQILREINFGECRRFKTAMFAISGALNFVKLVNFNLQTVQKFIKNHNSDGLNWQILHFYSRAQDLFYKFVSNFAK